MKPYIDLHCHTTASDGKLAPKDLVKLALKRKLKAIAITDHDTVNGIDEALKAAKDKNIVIIPGVEISCDDPGFIDTHILGLFISHKSKAITNMLKKSKKCRIRQKKAIIKKFQKLGFKITYKEVRALAKGEIGRPHIASVVLKNNPEKVSSADGLFGKYLGVGKKAYVERERKISINEAIKAVHSSDGLAFIAHPGVYINFDINKFIEYFIKNKGDGLETIQDYKKARPGSIRAQKSRLIKKFGGIAKSKGLLETGGSDFHGNKDEVLGRIRIPYSVLEKLKKNLDKFK